MEEEIANEIAEDNRNKALKALSDTDGTVNINGIRGQKRKTLPKNSKQLPLAKNNVENKIISSQSELKELYLDTFKHRLRHRPIKDDLKHLEVLKEELCAKRLKNASLNKSKRWDSEE